MGAIGGLFGLGGGAGGTGFAAPEQANIVDQGGVGLGNAAGEAYARNQAQLASQQRLNAALQQQGGLQRQASAFDQMQGVASGTGPNPAQAMLNQATGANVANQAALMAGQRGAAANVGLMARQAAQQGANLQQQAVGQGATMQANQSLNALGQLGGMANTMVANQMAGENAATSAEQSQYSNLLNALAAQNQARVGSQGSVNSANTALAGNAQKGQQGLLGGLMNAAGPALGLMTGGAGPAVAGASGLDFSQSGVGNVGYDSGGSLGGNKYRLAEGGQVPPNGPQSSFGQFLSDAQGSGLNRGGMVDVVLSPGEKVVPPGKVNEAAGGKVEAKTVPGKAKVAGDSIKNDTYKTKLPEGSVVVPRTKAGDEKDAAAFVRKVLAKRGRGK